MEEKREMEKTKKIKDNHNNNNDYNEDKTNHENKKITTPSQVLYEGGKRVAIKGFYDDVQVGLVDLAWTSLAHSQEFSCEGYRRALGVPSLAAPVGKRALLELRWCRPSLSVVDMRPGTQQLTAAEDARNSYRFGPTRFSVVPRTAEGKISVRFVPNQDPDKLVRRFREHLDAEFARLGSKNRLELSVDARGHWWEADTSSPFFSAAEVAVQKEWGVKPLYVREGGTMPVASQLELMLGAPALMIPMGQSSDNCHLDNERISRRNLVKGKNVIRRLLQEVAYVARAQGRIRQAGAEREGVSEEGGGDYYLSYKN